MTDDTRKAALEALRQLPCPNCDGSGAYPVGDGQGGCYAEQCQWCFEREQALQALEAPSGPPVPDLWLLDTADHVGRDWTDDPAIGKEYSGIPVKVLAAASDPGDNNEDTT